MDKAQLQPFIEKKAVKEWEKEGHKSYSIQALWQRNHDLGLICNKNKNAKKNEANSQPGLDEASSKVLSGLRPF